MQYLLDTHAILWYLFGNDRLSKSENDLTIVTTDGNIPLYDVKTFISY